MKTIVLYSGGLDSTYCLLDSVMKYGKENVIALTFFRKKEYMLGVEYSRKVCREWNIEQKLVEIDNLLDLIKKKEVDGRNLVHLSYAIMLANIIGASKIITGVKEPLHVEGDLYNYGDCSMEFIEEMNVLTRILTKQKVSVEAPLMHLSKEEVWEKCDELGYMEYIKENSTSCWIGGVTKECGVCEACQSRNQSYVSYVERKRLKDKQKGDEENCENVSSGIFKIMGAT